MGFFFHSISRFSKDFFGVREKPPPVKVGTTQGKRGLKNKTERLCWVQNLSPTLKRGDPSPVKQKINCRSF